MLLVLFAEYFQNKLVETIHFMEILNLKDSVEKDTFFRKLPNLAEQLPREIVLKKVLEAFYWFHSDPVYGLSLEFIVLFFGSCSCFLYWLQL